LSAYLGMVLDTRKRKNTTLTFSIACAYSPPTTPGSALQESEPGDWCQLPLGVKPLWFAGLFDVRLAGPSGAFFCFGKGKASDLHIWQNWKTKNKGNAL